MEDADLFTEPEFLVFGSFREDEADDGFKATRWLSASELERVEEGGGIIIGLRKLDELVSGLKDALGLEDDV